MENDVHILVVDDNQENLKVVNSLLKEENYKIALALDGKSALDTLEKTRIDIILLDIMMPGMDGFEVCKILKSNERTKNVPVIFLTAKSDIDDVVKGFREGGVDYITKPFRKEELIVRVRNQVQLKLARDFLANSEIEMRKSRDEYMRVLYGLSKILNRE